MLNGVLPAWGPHRLRSARRTAPSSPSSAIVPQAVTPVNAKQSQVGPQVVESLRGLYFHIPFCSVKCFYCDFTAFAGQRPQFQRYLRALESEAAAKPALKIHTLYVGGGTPSELSAEELSWLLRIAAARYGPAEDWAESTVEASPESLTREKLDALAHGGVRRLSLGLETAQPRLLKEIGRRHSLDDFLAIYHEARGLGLALNVDLMYGLPTQTLDEHLGSLDRVLSLEPEHLSLYGLQVEDRTLFSKRDVKTDEDMQREMFERSLDRLKAVGYRHYELSNFALPGHESIHNKIYWSNGEYVGLGCGASGFLAGVRYRNKDRLNDYCSAVEQGLDSVDSRESLTGKEKLGETLMLGLRMMDGIVLTPEMLRDFSREFESLKGKCWLSIEGETARLTREGAFLANRVFQEFVPPY